MFFFYSSLHQVNGVDMVEWVHVYIRIYEAISRTCEPPVCKYVPKAVSQHRDVTINKFGAHP